MSGGTNGPGLYLAYPYSRPHTDKFLRSVVNLAASSGYGSLSISPLYGYSLDNARNAIAASFLESDADYLLCVDNDCEFEPEAVLRALSYDLPMVAGCMYTRDIPPRPTCGHFVGQSKTGTFYYRYAEITRRIIAKAQEHGITHETATNSMVFPPTKTDLLEVDGVGLHFALIRRDVLEAIQPPYFAFLGSTTAGEDYYFCRKIKEAGFPIYLDLSVQTAHIESETWSFGIKQLLYIAQFLDLERDILDIDTWEFGK